VIGHVLKYVRHHDACDYLALGWLASPALAGTHHGADSVLMVWLCACPAAVPRQGAPRTSSQAPCPPAARTPRGAAMNSQPRAIYEARRRAANSFKSSGGHSGNGGAIAGKVTP
jgi:hypothetical protein